jgi:hypothetical protein
MRSGADCATVFVARLVGEEETPDRRQESIYSLMIEHPDPTRRVGTPNVGTPDAIIGALGRDPTIAVPFMHCRPLQLITALSTGTPMKQQAEHLALSRSVAD